MNSPVAELPSDSEFAVEIDRLQRGLVIRHIDAFERLDALIARLNRSVAWYSGEAMAAEGRATRCRERGNEIANRLMKAANLHKRFNRLRPFEDQSERPVEQAINPVRSNDPLDNLRLDPELVSHGQEIRLGFEVAGKIVMARIGRMESAGRPPQGVFREPNITEVEADLHARAYVPWTRKVERRWPGRFALMVDSVITYQPWGSGDLAPLQEALAHYGEHRSRLRPHLLIDDRG